MQTIIIAVAVDGAGPANSNRDACCCGLYRCLLRWTVFPKKIFTHRLLTPYCCPHLCQISSDLEKKFFTGTWWRKFYVKQSLKIQPHL